MHHTASWDDTFDDWEDKRVAVIGNVSNLSTISILIGSDFRLNTLPRSECCPRSSKARVVTVISNYLPSLFVPVVVTALQPRVKHLTSFARNQAWIVSRRDQDKMKELGMDPTNANRERLKVSAHRACIHGIVP
jgi:hypothetical protein